MPIVNGAALATGSGVHLHRLSIRYFLLVPDDISTAVTPVSISHGETEDVTPSSNNILI
jgi:hypothetical protein